MASNLTGQVRNIADVATAIAKGDLSRKITVDVKGEILQLKNTINTMVDQLNAFASEVSRVAREVGTEGKLGRPGRSARRRRHLEGPHRQRQLDGRRTSPARSATSPTSRPPSPTATSRERSRSTSRARFSQLKNTINTMVDQLNAFASEVTRVAREVGTEGKLGGQAVVTGVAGTWKDLTDNVNFMASNLTGQVRNIADVATSIARGDLSRKITVDVKGEILELKNTINTMVDQLNAFASEVQPRRARGRHGRQAGRPGAVVPGVAGTWKDLTDNVNSMASNLTGQVRNIAEVTIAVANGDLSKKITVDVRGEILQLQGSHQRDGRAAAIVRLGGDPRRARGRHRRPARRAGRGARRRRHLEGPDRLGQRHGREPDRAGPQHRRGHHRRRPRRPVAQDLRRRQGRNPRAEEHHQHDGRSAARVRRRSHRASLARSAPKASSAARPKCLGVAGTWKDLTDSVNVMAANLTDQVRGIVKVVTGRRRRQPAAEAAPSRPRARSRRWPRRSTT